MCQMHVIIMLNTPYQFGPKNDDKETPASIEIFPTILPVLASQYKVPLCRQGMLKMSNRAEKLGKHVQPFMQSLSFVRLKNTHCIFHLLEKCKLRSFQRTCFTYRLHR